MHGINRNPVNNIIKPLQGVNPTPVNYTGNTIRRVDGSGQSITLQQGESILLVVSK